MTYANLALGTPVDFTHVIVRDVDWFASKGKTKTWVEYERSGSGFIVGWRTLSNGHVGKVTESDGYYGSVHVDNQWIASEYFKAYMVTTDLRINLSWVLPARLEVK